MSHMCIYEIKELEKLNPNIKYLTINEYINIAKRIIIKFIKNSHRRYYLFRDDDIMSFLAEILILADGSYNPIKGTTLETWRFKRIRYALSDINKKYKKRKYKNSDKIDENAINRSHLIKRHCDFINDYDNKDELYTAINKLSDRLKHIVYLRLEGNTYREIATQLQLSHQRVEQLISKARNELETILVGD